MTKKRKGIIRSGLDLISIATVLVLFFAVSTTGYAAARVEYYHTDALGSVVASTDESGGILWRESYRPFGGRMLNEVSTQDNTPFYTGKPHDDVTGLSYFGARYYDPNIGRFLGVDPVGVDPENLHSFNRYAYANNNPYRYVDPDGQLPIVALAFVAMDFYSNYQDSGNFSDAAVATAVGMLNPFKKVKTVAKIAEKVSKVTKGAGKAASKSDDVIHVTKDGVALPPGSKHKIPDNYVQNPHRSGNYGEIVDGKFKERLRIDPPTPPGQKGPNYSHYHKNGKGTHYSPRSGDKDPGF